MEKSKFIVNITSSFLDKKNVFSIENNNDINDLKNPYNIIIEYNENTNLKNEFIEEYKKIMRDENLMWIIIRDICLGIQNFYSKIIKDRDLVK